MRDWYSELVSGPDDDAGYYPELVGDDDAGYYPELIGDDDAAGEDDAGRLVRPFRRRRRAMRRPGSRPLIGGHGTVLRQERPTSERRLILSGSQLIPPGATQQIQIVPQVIFRAEKMILQATSPATMLLIDVKVGTRSQLISAAQQGIPFPAFGPAVQDVLVEFDTASVQSFFQVLVSNTGASADTAFVTFLGTGAVT